MCEGAGHTCGRCRAEEDWVRGEIWPHVKMSFKKEGHAILFGATQGAQGGSGQGAGPRGWAVGEPRLVDVESTTLLVASGGRSVLQPNSP
jgi:hypothetical protein